MWKLATLFLIILVQDAEGVCNCYESGNYTGHSAPISNSFDYDNFSSCYSGPCSFVAYGGDDSRRWTHLTMRWGTVTNSGGLIEIFDGSAETDTPLIQIAEGEAVLDGSAKGVIMSTLPSIRIKYSQTGTGANVYYGVIRSVPGVAPSQPPTTDSPLPTAPVLSDST